MVHDDERSASIAGDASIVRPVKEQSADNDRFDLENLEKLSARDVAINSLSPGSYLRLAGTNAAHVRLLFDAAGTADLPPILVQSDGLRVIDGLHRLEATKLLGNHSIKVRLLDCTDEEALVLAIKSNTSHGLPLSKADRVSGAKQVLAAHPDWSDRAIAGITGLSANTIASLRSRSGGGSHLSGKRLGRDGRRRPVTNGEGRTRAAEYINIHPDAPLRQVAREVGVSLGTVHDVSARLRRGVSPERNGHRVPDERTAVQSQPAAGVPTSVTTAGTRTPLRCKKHTDTPLTWAGIAAKVANDPAIRYTEGGKDFLRWMSLHATYPDRWQEFIGAIPVHWLSVIAPIADSISEEWSLFSERLMRRKPEAAR
jgi:hypothetical protein